MFLAATPAMAAPSPDARIWYSANDYPRLALPDGQSQMVRSVLNITKPMRFGDFVWNEDGIAKGPLWVRIDLARQLVSVFRGGHEIGTAVILYGSDKKPSPTGTFTILQKAQHYYSRTYDAPMPYSLRLTDDGVAIHGSKVREGWASHGCIGVPLGFARHLFRTAKKGDPVAIMPAEQAHEKS